MTTGVIKLDSIDEAFDKTVIASLRTSSKLSNSDRSSSGVSSASNSPSSTPTVTSFSNPAADVLDDPRTYNNPALQLDPSELGSQHAPGRNVCTGVVSLRDELWLDVEAHLQSKPTALSTTRTLAEKCRHFVQSKWRSIPLSMLPAKEVNGDQRPLSPRDKDERDDNANGGAVKPSTAATAASTPSTSKAGAAPVKEAASKDPDTMPPFSCTPVYVIILLVIFIVLVVGAITTIIDLRPELIYGRAGNVTLSPLNNTIPV